MLKTIFTTSTFIACGILLAACQTTQNPRAEKHLSSRWEGRPVAEFESRFGKPVSGSQARMTWTTTYDEVTPAHERSFGFGVSGVMIGNPMKNKVAASSERKTCTIDMAVSNGTITGIDIVQDASTRRAASLCLLTFG
ncbi:hypothetical protein SAMN05421890_2086 [Ensifer adhaerens]|nr:hypothetical protein SAMN05421890_2086 [Ensifer adhaerens]